MLRHLLLVALWTRRPSWHLRARDTRRPPGQESPAAAASGVCGYNNAANTGLVTDQLPKAGDMVPPDTTVTLEIDANDPSVP